MEQGRWSVQPAMVGMVEAGQFAWKSGWKVVGYYGPGINFPVESEPTLSKWQAIEWAAKAEQGQEVPEAKFASYSDD